MPSCAEHPVWADAGASAVAVFGDADCERLTFTYAILVSLFVWSTEQLSYPK
jgi:hypothetical protein